MFWVNGGATFYKTSDLLKRNNKEISSYFRDKQIECRIFSIIQHHPITDNNDSDKDVLLY